ncbi:large eukaryotic DNA virus major capsid protein-domain-containing protein [Tribonema minus]|uniref:Large eukaryotic DNA virus major capsid protein-domain-containing protein n=1 Tax=Tribonema minus TaxID=303371 RepID=A0A835Z4S3_9STRA|nr:large eukaryotic DNA virus major capsid protein-domain-containing protein [Tribonema minus]
MRSEDLEAAGGSSSSESAPDVAVDPDAMSSDADTDDGDTGGGAEHENDESNDDDPGASLADTNRLLRRAVELLESHDDWLEELQFEMHRMHHHVEEALGWKRGDGGDGAAAGGQGSHPRRIRRRVAGGRAQQQRMTASGGVIQIAARGSQDAILNDSPTHTIWRSVHTRFTSCAMDDEFQDLSNSGFDTSSSATINRYGDLISRVTLEITLPPLAAPQVPITGTSPVTYHPAADTAAHWVNCIGFACWEDVQVEIGGSLVDQLYSDFAMIYEELAGRPGVRLEEAIGRVQFSDAVDEDLIEKAKKQQILYVPLPLWFSKYQPATYGLALPIVALTFHDVRIKIKTRSISECTCVLYKDNAAWKLAENQIPLNANTGTALVNADLKIRLMVTSVYLDTTERTAMSSVVHSFLISTAQRQVHSIAANQSTKQEEKLFFNHPASSLIWFVRPLDWNTEAGRRRFSCGFRDRYDFTAHEASTDASLPYGDAVDPIRTASLTLNGHARWPTDMDSRYFRMHMPYCAWRTMPTTSIYTYSFALEAHQWQPTSHLNFSRLDHVSLGWTFCPNIKSSEAFSFVEAYNLLVIRDGLGGLRFSN